MGKVKSQIEIKSLPYVDAADIVEAMELTGPAHYQLLAGLGRLDMAPVWEDESWTLITREECAERMSQILDLDFDDILSIIPEEVFVALLL